MTIVCNIWMICLELNWFFNDPSRILQLSLYGTDRRKISSITIENFSPFAYTPFHFSRTLPLCLKLKRLSRVTFKNNNNKKIKNNPKLDFFSSLCLDLDNVLKILKCKQRN